MPRRMKEDPGTIDELIEEVAAAEKNIAEELNPQLNVDRKRDELLKLAEDGDLDKSVAYVKKASVKIIEKLYVEYERNGGCRRQINF